MRPKVEITDQLSHFLNGSSLTRPRSTRYVAAVSTCELIKKEVAAMLEPLQREVYEVYDFARFLRLKNEDESFNGLLLSKSALAKDWNTPVEDTAWASL